MKSDRGMYRAIHAVLLDDLDFQKLSERARHLFHVLKVSRISNMAGIFICEEGEKLTLARQTGIPPRGVNLGLVELERGGWILCEGPILWLRNALKYDPGLNMNNKNHQKAVLKTIQGLPGLSILAKFCNYYGLGIPSGIPSRYHRDTIEIPSPITDTDTDTDTETETETETLLSRKRDERGPDSEIPFEEIIGHLNQLTGKNLDPKTEGHQKFVKYWWKRGATLEQFLHVNRVKTKQWLGTKREYCLRPKTLYNSENFDGYRNEREIPGAQLSDRTRANLTAAAQYLERRKLESSGPEQVGSDLD
jgi:uncharacterized phage protein (TIGR02220 family)